MINASNFITVTGRTLTIGTVIARAQDMEDLPAGTVVEQIDSYGGHNVFVKVSEPNLDPEYRFADEWKGTAYRVLGDFRNCDFTDLDRFPARVLSYPLAFVETA